MQFRDQEVGVADHVLEHAHQRAMKRFEVAGGRALGLEQRGTIQAPATASRSSMKNAWRVVRVRPVRCVDVCHLQGTRRVPVRRQELVGAIQLQFLEDVLLVGGVILAVTRQAGLGQALERCACRLCGRERDGERRELAVRQAPAAVRLHRHRERHGIPGRVLEGNGGAAREALRRPCR